MYPLLFQIGPLKLYTYGLMMALGFIFAISWGIRRAPRYGVSGEFISNLGWIIVVSGVVGGRVAFLAFEESISDIFSFRLFEVWKGGMVFYGGFMAAVLGSWIYSRKHKHPFLTIADIMSPTIALGHALGRIGCVFAGCCFGKQCDLPWAITFTHPLSLAPLHIALHPTQIYEALGLFLVVGLLFLVQKRQKFMGQIFVSYLTMYAILRSVVEEFRGDTERGFIDFWGLYPNEWLSTSRGIGAGMIVLAALIFWKFRSVPTPYSPEGK